MSVRTALLAGYLLFVLALGGLGAWSARHMNEMGGVSRRIIADNYDSVVAAQDMKESLERLDSGALFLLLDHVERARLQIVEHRRRFDRAFDKAARNITEPGEAAIIADLRALRDEDYGLLERFTSQGRSGTADYFASLQPVFDRLRGRVDDLLVLNQQAMRRKSAGAEAAAHRWFLTIIGLSSALVVAGIVLAAGLSRAIVTPLAGLTAATERMSAGELDVAAPVPRTGTELQTLAMAFNAMAAHIRELRQSDLGRLRLAQQLAEAAIDSLFDPVIVTDEAGRITRLNRAAEELFGAEAAAVGQPISHVASDTRLAAAVSEAMRSQQPVAGEGAASVLPLAVDGTPREYRLRTTPMRDDREQLLGSVTLLEDITHLREIDRVKSEFISIASHELRTPLTSALMGIQLLLEGAAGEIPERPRAVLEMCRQDCERLDRLMRELLDLSKLEARQHPPLLAPIALAALLESSLAPLRPQAESAGVALGLAVDAAAPTVRADRSQIERVVSNLVVNALRATPRGGRIDVRGTAESGHAVVSIRDTGIGIPPEHMPHLFEKFRQIPGSPSGGAGLGLSIARHIVESHGGRIRAQSQPGRGTTFTFTLPVAGDTLADGRSRPTEQEHSS